MNSVTLIGRLGKDVELRQTAGGIPVANFTLATSKKSKDKGEVTTWHKIVAWDKQAAVCAQYLGKGSQVAVQGEIQERSWTDKDGVKRYSTEIHAHHVEFLGSKGDRPQESQPAAMPETYNEPKKSMDDALSGIPF